MNHALRPDADDLFAIAAQRGDEKPIPFGVESEVVDASLDAWQGDCACQNKRGD
jgi:hypothetical protein